jgi:hypothetical protein
VVRRFEIEIERCLLDQPATGAAPDDGACRAGAIEVVVPGGTVWERVRGQLRLVDVHVTDPAIGAPPELLAESVFFLERLRGSTAWRIVPDRNARLDVHRRADGPRIVLAIDDPRLLSDEARRDPRTRTALARRGRGARPAEGVAPAMELLRDEQPLDALPELLERARALAAEAVGAAGR